MRYKSIFLSPELQYFLIKTMRILKIFTYTCFLFGHKKELFLYEIIRWDKLTLLSITIQHKNITKVYFNRYCCIALSTTTTPPGGHSPIASYRFVLPKWVGFSWLIFMKVGLNFMKWCLSYFQEIYVYK